MSLYVCVKLYQLVILCLLLFQPSECYKRVHSRNETIIGGKPANIKDYPHIVAMIKKTQSQKLERFICGADIVSQYWALTAAHCIQRAEKSLIKKGQLYLRGNTTEWTVEKYAQDHKVLEAYKHPKYRNSDHDCDIEILKVEKPFTSKYEKPIKVPSKRYKISQRKLAITAGWGTVDPEIQKPVKHLRYVVISIFNLKKCDKYKIHPSGRWNITNNMICAGTVNGGKDTCQGDSGGPLVQSGVLIGIVSFGYGCALWDYPGVYARVGAFQDWLIALEKKLKTKFHINYTDK